VLAENGIKCSMSGKGQCWDNAPMESFFGTLKKELVHDADYHSREEAKSSIFAYIETFYNTKRRHKGFGVRVPG
jgi:transposase InsO family protein